MEVVPHKRGCQNCKAQFAIGADDIDFYKKVDVPPPTFCPQCRFQRRLMWRNERTFYKRDCALCGKNVLTNFAPDKEFVVYCQPCWWSDKYDAGSYGMDYDPHRHFFEQLQELMRKAPWAALSTGYTTLVNSDYVNEAAYAKNSYLIFNADYNENCLYAFTIDHCKDAMDANLLESSELCYELINCEKCFKAFFSEDCISCTNVYFSKNLSGCNDCFGCVNLRNKKYHIWNEPCTKEEYEKKLEDLRLDSFAAVSKLREEAYRFWKKYPHKFMQGVHNVNVSGDYVWESKNSHFMYQTRSVEDGKYSQFMTLGPAKDIMDQTQWGNGVQRIYETLGAGEGADFIRFCMCSWSESRENEYSIYAISSSYLFGCVNMRKKKFCILNKQYSEEEYRALRGKIIADLDANPYVDAKGRVWKYGEFLPYDLSPFEYNETTAAELYPLSKEGVLDNGFRWREPVKSLHAVTLATDKIPDSIQKTEGSITKEILGCILCEKPFRIVPMELELLRRFNLPLPRACSNCRHLARVARTNPPRLWTRNCGKCGKEIQTSYAPERPEVVYCEQCYQTEVA